MVIRLAKENELDRINELRKQVNDLHVEGKPDVFMPGIASELISFIKAHAKEQGFNRIELNTWEFNQDALAFYEAAGFETYRRYMEMMI